MSLNIQLNSSRSNNPTISLDGRLDGETSSEFQKTFNELFSDEPAGCSVTLDLTNLDYISSMGLRIILQIRKTVEGGGGKLLMANLQPSVQHVMDIANVLPSWSLFESSEEADLYIDNMQQQTKEGL